MPKRGSLLMLVMAGTMLSACTSRQEVVQSHEDLLAAAGFTARPANTPERQTALRSLPPHHFVQRAQGDHFVYLYADPLVCDCLYIGNQDAYNRYRREMLQRQIASDRLAVAQMRADAAWNWGPWGPGWWWY